MSIIWHCTAPDAACGRESHEKMIFQMRRKSLISWLFIRNIVIHQPSRYRWDILNHPSWDIFQIINRQITRSNLSIHSSRIYNFFLIWIKIIWILLQSPQCILPQSCCTVINHRETNWTQTKVLIKNVHCPSKIHGRLPILLKMSTQQKELIYQCHSLLVSTHNFQQFEWFLKHYAMKLPSRIESH